MPGWSPSPSLLTGDSWTSDCVHQLYRCWLGYGFQRSTGRWVNRALENPIITCCGDGKSRSWEIIRYSFLPKADIFEFLFGQWFLEFSSILLSSPSSWGSKSWTDFIIGKSPMWNIYAVRVLSYIFPAVQKAARKSGRLYKWLSLADLRGNNVAPLNGVRNWIIQSYMNSHVKCYRLNFQTPSDRLCCKLFQ